MAQVTPKELTEFLLHDLRENKFIVFIWGPPGVGKSSIVMQCAQELNLSVYPLSVALEHPHALGGFPAINWRERAVAKLPPAYTQLLENCVLFLDDFAASDPSQQRIALSLTTYRRVGDAPLPQSTRIVLASNRIEDFSYIVRPSLAVMNRMKHYTLLPSLSDWVEFIDANKGALQIHNMLVDYAVAYLNLYPSHFCVFPSDLQSAQLVYPTPRSWTMLLQDLSALLRAGKVTIPPTDAQKQRAIQIVCESFIGDVGKQFANFLCVDINHPVLQKPSSLASLQPHEQARYVLALLAQRGSGVLQEVVGYLSSEAAAILSYSLRAANIDSSDKLVVALKSLGDRRRKR